MFAGLISSKGHEGMICCRPFSLACRQLSSPVCSYGPFSLPHPLFLTSSSYKDTSQIGLKILFPNTERRGLWMIRKTWTLDDGQSWNHLGETRGKWHLMTVPVWEYSQAAPFKAGSQRRVSSAPQAGVRPCLDCPAAQGTPRGCQEPRVPKATRAALCRPPPALQPSCPAQPG